MPAVKGVQGSTSDKPRRTEVAALLRLSRFLSSLERVESIAMAPRVNTDPTMRDPVVIPAARCSLLRRTKRAFASLNCGLAFSVSLINIKGGKNNVKKSAKSKPLCNGSQLPDCQPKTRARKTTGRKRIIGKRFAEGSASSKKSEKRDSLVQSSQGDSIKIAMTPRSQSTDASMASFCLKKERNFSDSRDKDLPFGASY